MRFGWLEFLPGWLESLLGWLKSLSGWLGFFGPLGLWVLFPWSRRSLRPMAANTNTAVKTTDIGANTNNDSTQTTNDSTNSQTKLSIIGFIGPVALPILGALCALLPLVSLFLACVFPGLLLGLSSALSGPFCVLSGRSWDSPRLSWALGPGPYQHQLRVQTKNMQCHSKGLRPPTIRNNLQINNY